MSDSYPGQERRSSTRFDVKSEILSSIAKTQDQTIKSLLLIMLGVLEEIGGKIDNVISDEKAMREMVLNGHASVHHAHHVWVEQKMKEEDESREDNRHVKNGVTQSVITNIALLILGGLLTYLGLK